MYKYRIMVNDVEKKGIGLFSYDGDFRIIKVGGFLRKISFDELF